MCEVPISDSCTKCVGSPSVIHDNRPDCDRCILGMDAWMTSQPNAALISKLHGSLMCLTHSLICLDNQAFADKGPNEGEGIENEPF